MQVVHGILLGAPGAVGSKSIGIFYGQGSPATSTLPEVQAAAIGSLYLDTVAGVLYVNQAVGGWAAK